MDHLSSNQPQQPKKKKEKRNHLSKLINSTRCYLLAYQNQFYLLAKQNPQKIEHSSSYQPQRPKKKALFGIDQINQVHIKIQNATYQLYRTLSKDCTFITITSQPPQIPKNEPLLGSHQLNPTHKIQNAGF